MTPHVRHLLLSFTLASPSCIEIKVGGEGDADPDADDAGTDEAGEPEAGGDGASGEGQGGAGGDSADGGSGDDTADGGTDGEVSSRLESCDWPGFGLCFEFIDEPDVDSWCDGLGETYGFETVYGDGACGAGATGMCEGLTGGDFGALVATAYYYRDYPAEPREACADSGGSYSRL